jgi:hypothetical protein
MREGEAGEWVQIVVFKKTTRNVSTQRYSI